MWLSFLVAFLTSACLAYPIYLSLIRLKSRQTVSQFAPEGHQVKQGTPTMGGLIIVAGVIASMFVVPNVRPFSIVFLGYTVIGFIDDFVVPRYIKGKRGLGWKQKILMQLGVALLAGAGPNVSWASTAAFVFLVLFLSNAYNFSDGLDGLAGSLGLWIMIGMAGIGLGVGYVARTPLLAAAVFGATLPFLYLNAPPAKVFMGDVGSLPIGALLGAMTHELLFPVGKASMFDPASEWYIDRPFKVAYFFGERFVPLVSIALLVLFIMMIVELVPVPMQIASVKLLKRKIFPYTPIHHAFEKAGWPETRVVYRFVLVQVVLTIVAMAIVGQAAKPVVSFDPRMRTAVNRP